MKIEAVVFDLDGTLIHTKHKYIFGVMSSTFKRLGISFTKETSLELWFGCKRNEILSKWGIESKNFWKTFHIYDTVEERKKNVEPYEDHHILKELAKKGVKLGIVTGSPQHFAEMELDALGIDFDAVVITRGEKEKPSPVAIKECLKLLETKKENAVFVGNGDEDITAAKKLGIRDIHLDRGEHKISSSPSKTIKSLEELMEMMK